MQNNITTVSYNSILPNREYFSQRPRVKINDTKNQTKLSKNQRIGIFTSSMLGVATAVAILAKIKGYSLSPNKILKTPLSETFLGKEDYKMGKVLTLGAGSCIGGYLGGLLFDRNKNNRQAKKRESLIQYINIAFPIVTVGTTGEISKIVKENLPKKLANTKNKALKFIGYTGEILSTLAALGIGIFTGNHVSNKINKKIFKNNDVRPVELTDMSAHVDDACVASGYIAPNSIITKGISKIVPLALIVPGYEIGTKQEQEINKR